MQGIVEVLTKVDAIATGRLFTQLSEAHRIERRGFEDLLNAMARAGVVTIIETSFEKDGKRIDFRKASLSEAGAAASALDEVNIAEEIAGPARSRVAKKRIAKRAREKPAKGTPIEAALKAWRVTEAKKKGVPAFRILTDKSLEGIAATRPANESELLSVPGIGPKIVEKYGAQIIRVLMSNA
jgi:superfamily II DNA helicase RecQ